MLPVENISLIVLKLRQIIRSQKIIRFEIWYLNCAELGQLIQFVDETNFLKLFLTEMSCFWPNHVVLCRIYCIQQGIKKVDKLFRLDSFNQS